VHDNCPNSLNMPQPKRHFYSSRTNLASLLIETAISQFLSPKYRDKRVCLSVSALACSKSTRRELEFRRVSTCAIYAVARSSVKRRNTSCTSGFLDDVMFSRNGQA